MKLAEKVKEFFHNEGIHSTTIQPEFVEVEVYKYTNIYDCILNLITLNVLLKICLFICMFKFFILIQIGN